ncbi:MAG: hypothetical protein AAFQ51_09010 [Pseudomonadota bacterium]
MDGFWNVTLGDLFTFVAAVAAAAGVYSARNQYVEQTRRTNSLETLQFLDRMRNSINDGLLVISDSYVIEGAPEISKEDERKVLRFLNNLERVRAGVAMGSLCGKTVFALYGPLILQHSAWIRSFIDAHRKREHQQSMFGGVLALIDQMGLLKIEHDHSAAAG